MKNVISIYHKHRTAFFLEVIAIFALELIGMYLWFLTGLPSTPFLYIWGLLAIAASVFVMFRRRNKARREYKKNGY